MIISVSPSMVISSCDYVNIRGDRCDAVAYWPLSDLGAIGNLLHLPGCPECGTLTTINATKPEEAGYLNAPHPGLDLAGGLHTPAVRQLIYAQAIKGALAGEDPADVLASYRISD